MKICGYFLFPAPAVQSPADALTLSLSLNCWLLILLIWASVQLHLLQGLHCLRLQGHSMFLRSRGSLAGAFQGSAEWGCHHVPCMGCRGWSWKQALWSHPGLLCWAQTGEHSVPGAGKKRVHQPGLSFVISSSQSSGKWVSSLETKPELKDFFEESWLFLTKADFSCQKPGYRGGLGVRPVSLPQLGLPRSLVAGLWGKCWGAGKVLERHKLHPIAWTGSGRSPRDCVFECRHTLLVSLVLKQPGLLALKK